MIRRVLADGGLQLRCQRVTPIGADSSALPHFELLLGVKDEHGGIALPGEFLQTAERNNQMRDVDLWVIETALRWMAENPTRVDQADGYSINLSGFTLIDDGLVERVSRMIADSGVSPGKVIFEVTESSAIDSMPVAVNFVHALKEYGCRFSLDKFGSGVASLAHLETLPIDYVKIDGSLVRDIATDPRGSDGGQVAQRDRPLPRQEDRRRVRREPGSTGSSAPARRGLCSGLRYRGTNPPPVTDRRVVPANLLPQSLSAPVDQRVQLPAARYADTRDTAEQWLWQPANRDVPNTSTR